MHGLRRINSDAFIDKILYHITGRGWYYFVDDYLGYNKIYISPKEKEKTTLSFPYGTFALRKM